MSQKFNFTIVFIGTAIFSLAIIFLIPYIDVKALSKYWNDHKAIMGIIGFGVTIGGYMFFALSLKENRELKEYKKVENDQREEIKEQNKTIIKNQVTTNKNERDHISEVDKMTKQLNKNEASDNKVLKEMLLQTKKIDVFIKGQEERDEHRDNEIVEIKEWMVNHDELHKSINSNIE